MLKKLLKKLKLNESSISMVLGLLVVIVIGGLVINYFRNVKKVQAPEKETTVTENQKASEITDLPAKYVVKKGDSLWQIANDAIGSGYNWVDIAKENNLTDPDQLTEGQQLTIPKVEVREPLVASAVEPTITDNTYTVVKGDNLWKISLRAYGDGYQWVKIARENNLTNPDLIHAGNVLTIPR